MNTQAAYLTNDRTILPGVGCLATCSKSTGLELNQDTVNGKVLSACLSGEVLRACLSDGLPQHTRQEQDKYQAKDKVDLK